jgi:hypothetical protein
LSGVGIPLAYRGVLAGSFRRLQRVVEAGFNREFCELDRFNRFNRLGRLAAAGLGLAYLGGLSLGLYEITAKSPTLLGDPLPGWWATDRAERTTHWDPPTGFLPLDKLLHEGEEAARFYHFLTLRSSRSLSNAR